MAYEIFISFKNNDENGKPTKESKTADKLYKFLTAEGFRVFFSNVELEFTGKAQYTKVIDEALDSSRFLVAVGSSHENLNSQWVRYEWESFLNDIRSDIKPNAEVFVVLDGMKIHELPRALRQQQAFDAAESESFERLCRFISNALGAREVVKQIDSDAPIPSTSIFADTVLWLKTNNCFSEESKPLNRFNQFAVSYYLLNLDYPPNLAPSAQDQCDEYIKKCFNLIEDNEIIASIEKIAKDLMVKSFAKQELEKRNELDASHPLYKMTLEVIGCVMRPLDDDMHPLESFTDKELETMAIQEHEWWMEEKLKDGWTYAPVRNNDKKHHECLVPWHKLPKEGQGWDKEACANIIPILRKIGFGVYRK